tara:strand:+ start:10764 stop:11486 length:723 start_codon:yes stop_codon:yes gene_type:complete
MFRKEIRDNLNLFIIPEKIFHPSVFSFMTNKIFDQNLTFKHTSTSNKLVIPALEDLIAVPIICMNQIHGNEALEVSRSDLNKFLNADAIYTQSKKLALAVSSADCLPIILASNDASEIAAIHVGWRGLANGVIDSTLKLFKNKHSELSAWFAPCISIENFEVSKDVLEQFNNKNLDKFFFPLKAKDKWKFDLRNAALKVMQRKGVKVNQSNLCTYTEDNLFYSYRRDKTSKRMQTIVWIN